MVNITEKKTFWKTLINVLESHRYFFRCSQELAPFHVFVEALHGSHVFCLSSHVRWRCARAQRENTKRILLLFSYGNITCRHLQICYLLYEHTLIINIWII